MTIDEDKDLLLEDEINIGYDVEEDDLPDQYDDESYIDGLLTTGFHAVDASEMFGYEMEVPEQNGWDVQTYDNLVDEVMLPKW